jgi:hypothetical protein
MKIRSRWKWSNRDEKSLDVQTKGDTGNRGEYAIDAGESVIVFKMYLIKAVNWIENCGNLQ